MSIAEAPGAGDAPPPEGGAPASALPVSYDEALERFARLRALDDATILPNAGSRLWTHGAPADRAVVLLHGFTNCPLQYDKFGTELFERGWNVIAPRFEQHGRADRDARPLGAVAPSSFLTTAFDAYDLACGLGKHVSVLGISSGGALASHLAFRRTLARAVIVAPLFGLLRLPHAVDALLAPLLAAMPNFNIAWDPTGKNDEIPSYAYTHFPTKALGELLGIGLDVAGSLARPLGREAVVVTNDHDPAVNNAIAEAAGARWNRRKPGFATFYRFTDLPENHDIIDPTDARQRVDLVYPMLIDLLERP